MNETLLNLLGAVAAILTTGGWVPQAIQSCRTRSARDFSWGYLGMMALGVSLWAVYGILRRDPAVSGANIVTLGLVLVVGAVKMSDRGGVA